MNTITRTAVVLLAFPAVATPAVLAQSAPTSSPPAAPPLGIECPGSSTCTFTQKGAAPVEVRIRVVRGTGGVKDATVRPVADQVPVAPRVTPASGEVRFHWTGRTTAKLPAEVRVEVEHWGETAARTIRISQAPPPAKPSLKLVATGDTAQTHFTNWRLRSPLQVIVTDDGRPLPRATCEKTVVDFAAVGPGESMKASATGVYDASASTCTASTPWFAGAGVGRGTVRATIADHPESHAAFTVRARKVSRAFIGVVMHWPRHRVAASLDTVRYQLPNASDPAGEPTDTFGILQRADTTRRPFTAQPMVGVDLPLWAFDETWTHRVRASMAFAVPDPRDRFFFGFSLFQLAVGLPMEGTGLDLHVGVLRARSTSTAIRQTCLGGAPTACKLVVEEVDTPDWSLAVMGTLEPGKIAGAIISSVTGLGGG